MPTHRKRSRNRESPNSPKIKFRFVTLSPQIYEYFVYADIQSERIMVIPTEIGIGINSTGVIAKLIPGHEKFLVLHDQPATGYQIITPKFSTKELVAKKLCLIDILAVAEGFLIGKPGSVQDTSMSLPMSGEEVCDVLGKSSFSIDFKIVELY